MADPLHSPPAKAGLALIGYRASGKTTVGRLLASQLGRPFVDADAELERRSGRSISSIFATEGEEAFRDLEARTIRDLCRESPTAVLSTGGGVILRESNRGLLSEFGPVVWLRAPAEVLVARLQCDSGDRPALTAAGLLDEVAHVLHIREPLYHEASDVVIDSSISDPDGIAREVIERLSLTPDRKGAGHD